MGSLEQSFATYMVDINALQLSDTTLAGINAPYARTYILEDSYLNALVSPFQRRLPKSAKHAVGTARGDH
jgi:hypothetical protein